ncbi:hypothetical protein [Streptomyces mexicanus]|uniref:hypothetical protein n=1 Tax=Streptomyces mexicanus TaxID=178566 RepID=UPI00365B9DA5
MKNPFVGTGLRRYSRAHLRHDRDAARAEVLRLEGVIRSLDNTIIQQGERIAQLELEAADASVERKLREQAERKAGELVDQLLELQAAAANEHAVTVPAPVDRGICPDAPTLPRGIPVIPLPQALNPATA